MIPQPLAIPSEPTPEVLDRLAEAVTGRGPLLLPHAPDEDAPDTAQVDERFRRSGGGVAVGTSGSTGTAKRAVLSADALAASADATHARLGGPGQWLLALPPQHIAGLQVVLRSLRAGRTPAVVPPGSFTPARFVAGAAGLTEGRRYTSLVPTQLGRILGDAAATRAAAGLDAVLVGGSRVRADLLDRARAAGIPVVVTYGMSETCGGCVYDGLPLDGVRLRTDGGRIHLAGPVLASGYLITRPGFTDPFVRHEGLTWFRTDDMGHLDADGRLVVDGRADDVIVSGGMKVWPADVERALVNVLPPGCDLAVVGVPDPEWGHRVAVVIEDPGDAASAPASDAAADAGRDLVGDLIAHSRDVLPDHARPRLGRTVRALPRLGPGKPDRARIAALLTDREWDDGPTTVRRDGLEEG